MTACDYCVRIFPGGVRPMTAGHFGSNVVSSSFPLDRQSVNTSAREIIRGFLYPWYLGIIINMGINTLLPFLKEVRRETFVDRYKGKTAAVDASCWLHKALTVSVQRTGLSERYVFD